MKKVENVHVFYYLFCFQNIWIRYSVVGFIISTHEQLDEIDSLCYAVPAIQPFLKHKLISFMNQVSWTMH